MEKDYILLNLIEAKESLEKIIEEIQNDENYNAQNFNSDIRHLYWHINSAWNGREFNINKEEFSNELYNELLQFPKDIKL